MTDRRYLQSTVTTLAGLNWLLVGGTMVELHCERVGISYTRATHDVDIVVNPLNDTSAALVCERLTTNGFTAVKPFHTDGHLHRFTAETGWNIDVMTKDDAKNHSRVWTYPLVECRGARSALGKHADNRPKEQISIDVGNGLSVLIPNVWSAIALKGHAYRTPSPGPKRHVQDAIALLACASIDNDFRPLSKSEKEALNYILSSSAMRDFQNWLPLSEDYWKHTVTSIGKRRAMHDFVLPVPVAQKLAKCP